jgi:hypothetical protein
LKDRTLYLDIITTTVLRPLHLIRREMVTLRMTVRKRSGDVGNISICGKQHGWDANKIVSNEHSGKGVRRLIIQRVNGSDAR